MNNIESYYYIIIGIGLFIMFALVGYLVEISKKTKVIEKKDINNNVSNELNNNILIDNEVVINKDKEIPISSDIIDNDILNK